MLKKLIILFLLMIPSAIAFQSGSNIISEAVFGGTSNPCSNFTQSAAFGQCNSQGIYIEHSSLNDPNNFLWNNGLPNDDSTPLFMVRIVDFNYSASNDNVRFTITFSKSNNTNYNPSKFSLFSHADSSDTKFADTISYTEVCDVPPISNTTYNFSVVVNRTKSTFKCYLNETFVAEVDINQGSNANNAGNFSGLYFGEYAGQTGQLASTFGFKGLIIANGSGILPISNNTELKAFNIYNNQLINSFNVSLINQTYIYNDSTNNGTIIISSLPDGIYNITFRSNNYFERNYYQINLSGDSYNGYLFQSILYVNATDIEANSQISNFGIIANGSSILNLSNSTGFATLYLNQGTYHLVGNSTPYFNKSSDFTISSLEEKYLTLQFPSHQLRVSAKNQFTNDSISSFGIAISGLNVSYSDIGNTTNGNVTFNIANGNYTLTISGSNLPTANANVTVDSIFTNYTFNLLGVNSIYINIYREDTLALIGNTSVKAVFDSSSSSFNLSTVNSTIYAENIAPETYIITLSASGFTTRNYILTLEYGSGILLNAYLGNSSLESDITFVLRDASTTQLLENVLVSVYHKINSSYVLLEQKYSDIVGTAIFTLDQTKKYRFSLVKSGFETKIFDLQPTSTSYTVNIIPSTGIDYSTIFDKVTYIIYPNNSVLMPSYVNFSLTTISLEGVSQNYFGLNLTYLGTPYKSNISGSPAGGTSSINLNLSTINFQSLGITYFIAIDGQIPYRFERTYYFSNVTAINQTAVATLGTIKSKLNEGYLAIAAVLLTIIVMATFSSMGIKDTRLGVIGAITLGFFAVLGWIPMFLWIIIFIILLAAYFIGRPRDDSM